MLESRDGSENVDQQVVYGTQYVDEIVRTEDNGKGTMFVFQDANWNVTGTVSYAGDVLDRLHTTPYGEPMSLEGNNLYGYVAQNPFIWLDPTGALNCWWEQTYYNSSVREHFRGLVVTGGECLTGPQGNKHSPPCDEFIWQAAVGTF